METGFEHLARRQLGQVFRDVDPARVEVQVLHGLALLAGTQDDTEVATDRGARFSSSSM